MFSSSTFIAAYGNSDKAIRILNTLGTVVYTINICNYQKSSVNGNNLNISMEDNSKEYFITFSSNNEAKQAMILFKQAIDSLRGNCVQTAVDQIPGDPLSIIATTYLQYKALQQSNQLGRLQWYDVIDATNLLFNDNVYVIRIFSKSENDSHPRGQILATRAFVSINTIKDKVIYYEDPQKSVTFINSDFKNSYFDAACENIMVTNDSMATIDASTCINVDNNSVAVLSNCHKVNILNGANVVMYYGTNVTVDNIHQDFTSLSFYLNNVSIDKNNSIGKAGRVVRNNPSAFQLDAYNDPIDCDMVFTSDNNWIQVKLVNDIVLANAEFRLRYSGNGENNIINVVNEAGDTLFDISDNNKGNTVVFRYDFSSTYFVVDQVKSDSINSHEIFNFIPTLNQTSFPINYPPTDATKMEFYVNGKKLLYGSDFHYDSNVSDVIFTPRFYSLDSDDEVEIIVY